MRLKVIKESAGILKKPSNDICVSEQGIPCTHGWTFSGITPAISSKWNRVISQPTATNTPAERTTPGLYGNRPRARITTRGYRATRWYQHSLQMGTAMTSLKKRLPSVALNATMHAAKSSNQPVWAFWGKVVSFTVLIKLLKKNSAKNGIQRSHQTGPQDRNCSRPLHHPLNF